MYVIAVGVQNKCSGGVNQIALVWSAFGGVMLVQCGPRSKIVPAEIGRQTKDISRLLALGRARLQHSVVDADVFALGIQLFESSWKVASPERSRNFLKQGSALGKVLAKSVCQGSSAP